MGAKGRMGYGVRCRRLWRCDNMRSRHILELDRYVNPTFMHSIDRCSMAHALEVRLPFLDHNLVDFAVNLPAGRGVDEIASPRP
jgi:asparagine synthetase B (glutamine-hydrolysing)